MITTIPRVRLVALSWITLLSLSFVTWSQPVQTQTTPQPPQEIINQRITAIFKRALAEGIEITPEGYRTSRGRISCTLEESEEIAQYGENAIAPLAEILATGDPLQQALATRILRTIRSPRVFAILTDAAENHRTPATRYSALLNIAGYPWPDVVNVIRRIARNDQEWTVRSRAQFILKEHEPPAPDNTPPSQEIIKQRIVAMFKEDLPIGTERTPEGFSQSDYGQVFWTPLHAAEIKEYGEKAIAPLSEYLISGDARTRQLAIQFLAMIRGPRVLQMLTEVVEKDTFPVNRSTALASLGQYPWEDITDLVKRIAANDQDSALKSQAQEMLKRHEVENNTASDAKR